MNFTHFIGFDMDKEFFTTAIHNLEEYEAKFKNNPKGIKKMLVSLEKMLKMDLDKCLFCFEHTGLYSLEMARQLTTRDLKFVMIPGLELKRSLGMVRGKEDFVDAHRIAEYAFLRQDRLKVYKLPEENIQKLKDLLSLRTLHVRTRASYLTRIKEQARVLKKTKNHVLFSSQDKVITTLNKQIERVDKEIKGIINNCLSMSKQYDLLISIVGIGNVLAIQLIVKTQSFTAFENWRQFACYCGTAPFPNQSGKSVKRNKISNLCDKEMKSLLTMAARSASVYDPEIKAYKHSVIKRGTPYVVMHKYAS